MGLTAFHQNTKHLLQYNKSLSDFKGNRVAIDVSGWIHRSAVVHAREFFLGQLGDEKPWCDFVHQMLRMILDSGLIPVVVFDGPERLPLKKQCSDRRLQKREHALREGIALEVAMDIEESRKKFMQAFTVTTDIEKDVMDLVDELDGVKKVVAVYEADAQIAELFNSGEVDLAISEDSDLVAYGVTNIIFKLRLSGEFEYLDIHQVPPQEFESNRGTIILLHEFTKTQLALLGTFIGNDYLANPPKMGIKKIYNLVKDCTTWDDMVASLKEHVMMDDDYYFHARQVFDLFMQNVKKMC